MLVLQSGNVLSAGSMEVDRDSARHEVGQALGSLMVGEIPTTMYSHVVDRTLQAMGHYGIALDETDMSERTRGYTVRGEAPTIATLHAVLDLLS